jgi:hypothetical protein
MLTTSPAQCTGPVVGYKAAFWQDFRLSKNTKLAQLQIDRPLFLEE